MHGDQVYNVTSKVPAQVKYVSSFDAVSGTTGVWASFLFQDDPYESSKLEILKHRWLEDSKILYGEFKPAKHDDAMKKINKQHLPEVVGYIKRNLLADWQDISFVIGTNPEDFIELRFEVESVDSPAGLRTYLNNLVNSNEFVLKYQLRRVSPYWNLYSQSGR